MRARFFMGRLLALCLAAAPVTTFADSIDISCGGGCPLGIPTAVGVYDSVVNEATTGTITDVVVFVDITYPFMQNLVIELLHGGQAVTLFDQLPPTGGGFADMAVTFDDAAALSITTQTPPYVGTFQPFPDALSLLDGLELSGDWTLRVRTIADFGFTGDLEDWVATVQFTPSGGQVPIPGTLALFAAAAMGGAGFRRRHSRAVI